MLRLPSFISFYWFIHLKSLIYHQRSPPTIIAGKNHQGKIHAAIKIKRMANTQIAPLNMIVSFLIKHYIFSNHSGFNHATKMKATISIARIMKISDPTKRIINNNNHAHFANSVIIVTF